MRKKIENSKEAIHYRIFLTSISLTNILINSLLQQHPTFMKISIISFDKYLVLFILSKHFNSSHIFTQRLLLIANAPTELLIVCNCYLTFYGRKQNNIQVLNCSFILVSRARETMRKYVDIFIAKPRSKTTKRKLSVIATCKFTVKL